jgi:hypothetical protein
MSETEPNLLVGMTGAAGTLAAAGLVSCSETPHPRPLPDPAKWRSWWVAANREKRANLTVPTST